MGKKKRSRLKGSTFNNRHTTVIEHAFPIVRLAGEDSRVRKMTIGPIKQARGGRLRLKIVYQPAGLRITVRAPGSVQTFNVMTSKPEGVKAAIEDVWKYDITS